MRVLFFIAIVIGTAQSFGMLLSTPSSQRGRWKMRVLPVVPQQQQQRRMSASNESDDGEMDWREMRARLIAQEQKADSTSSTSATLSSIGGDITTGTDGSTSSYVYETPLIEQGCILLGGTKMEFGFALRQQFFHKSVMLLLQHDESFTKGIILNRPSALEVNGWRAWCGHGQVADGGMFVGEERKIGELEINVLHSLTSREANEVSTRVIKGVSYTSLEEAELLVANGVAKKSDFWVCVGYSGWAPGQLMNEVKQRDSWYLASADSGTLLTELLREAKDLPPPGSDAIIAESGIDTWSNLMRSIGREKDVLQSLNTFEDRMLEQWVRVHLVPKPKPRSPATPPPEIKTGMVIGTMVSPETGLPADRFLIHDQYLHKALLLVIDASPGGRVSAIILNRPTASLFKLDFPGNPQRRVSFCGDIAIGSELWLHHRSDLGGNALGDSGLSLLSTAEVVEKIQAAQASASDFLLVRGVVQFGHSEITGMLSAGEMRCITPGERLSGLWPRVWALTDEENGTRVSDGTEMWWLASQCGGAGGAEQPAAPVTSDLADKALSEWLKLFARPQS